MFQVIRPSMCKRSSGEAIEGERELRRWVLEESAMEWLVAPLANTAADVGLDLCPWFLFAHSRSCATSWRRRSRSDITFSKSSSRKVSSA